MKQYPSIEKDVGYGFPAYIFDKLDGSNLRFEWDRKKGWYKFGTRSRMFDRTDPIFAPAIPLFMANLSEPLTKMARDHGADNKWHKIVVFCEFWGVNSFAGLHDPADRKFLSLFDISIYKRGLLPPSEFLKLTDKYLPDRTNHQAAEYLGTMNWTQGLRNMIYTDGLIGVTFEGVVGKHDEGSSIRMVKAKTKKWIDKVKEKYGDNADELLNS